MSQATLSERPYVNSNLFSGHYLDERVQERDEWDCDVSARQAMEGLQAVYELEGQSLPGIGEDALIDNWIDEVLDILGFGTHQEATLPEGGGFVDELLFESPSDRREALSIFLDSEDTTDVFERAVAMLEAKQWDAAFNVQFSEQRPYRNASHQTKHYLENTPPNIQWGVLTNGRKWRLYGTNDYETQTYYEVDLPELLQRGDLEAFKYFYVFFRPAAFHESDGTTFLDEVWSESETASQELGENLQDNVFTALRVLGRGFVETNDDLDIDPDNEEALDELKDQSLVFLYRLMFVLYAEARGLIHPENQRAQDDYEENFSLNALRLEIHEEIGEVDEGFTDEFSTYSTGMWSRLEDLFRLIDQGEEDLGIPPYNGGLFDHEEHEFLTEHEVSNRYLAEVIYRLSTTRNDEGRYVLADYADLDTRHLGSVYEGLLEHQFRIAPEQYAAVAEDGGQVWKPATEVSVAEAVETAPKGGLYVVNDEGERKATGAYYTPDYVVTYIVEETVGPLVEGIREDLIDQGFEPGTQEYIGPFFRRVTDLRILDPAMGSGHFLTKATGYLSEQVMAEVREAESEFGVAFDEQHIRREIAKECIYGVDVNGMAVELAKLSMWLETLAADRPLAFLDHHFKSGNSLVGSDVTEVLSEDDEDMGQLTLTQALARVRRNTLVHVMDLMEDLLSIDNETLSDIDSMKDLYAEIQADPIYQRLFELLNVHTAERFGCDVPEDAYERMAGAIETGAEWTKIESEDWFRTAQTTAVEEKFFHWELEFLEVFFDMDGEKREDAGFDAVVGNPPWLNAWSMTEQMPTTREAVKQQFGDSDILSGHWDLYIPFVVQSISLCAPSGKHSFILPNTVLTEKYATNLRQALTSEYSFDSILDFGEESIFRNVERQCVVYVVNRESSSDSHQIREATTEPFSFQTVSKVEDSLWEETYNNQIRVDSTFINNSLPLLGKVVDNAEKLGQYLYVNVGVTVASKETGKFSKEDMIHQTPTGNAKKVLQGGDVGRYRVEWSEKWLDYRKEEMSGARTPEMFECEKLIVRVRTDEGGHLAAGYDAEGFYCDDTLIVCCDYDELEGTSATVNFRGYERAERMYDLEFFLGVINSTFTTWLFKNRFETGGLQGSYSDVWPQSVRGFTIPSNKGTERTLSEANLGDVSDFSINQDTTLHDALIQLSQNQRENHQTRDELNLNLLDYLGNEHDGPILAEIGLPQPPEGVADSILVRTAKERPNLRVGRAKVVRNSTNAVEIQSTARYKPEDGDAYETDQWGYTETEPMPAMRLTDLTEAEADLVEAFVPVAVEEAGGFAGFRETATKTNSLVDRLEAITLPDPEDVADDLERYREATERAEELDEKIQRTDDLIDEIVYDLYGLTDEEIAIVEKAVSAD